MPLFKSHTARELNLRFGISKQLVSYYSLNLLKNRKLAISTNKELAVLF